MSLTDEAIARIRALIQSGKLRPGSRLPPEQQLAAELGISRSPQNTLRARVWRGMVEANAADRTLAEHEAIYTALADSDANLAQAAALMHVSTTERWLRRVHAAAEGTSDEEPDALPSLTGT